MLTKTLKVQSKLARDVESTVGRGLPMYSREHTRLTPRGVEDDGSWMLGSQGLQEVAFLARDGPSATRLLPNYYSTETEYSKRRIKPDLLVSLTNYE